VATPLSGGSDRTGGFASNVPSFGDVPAESVVRICVDQVEVAAGRLPHDRSAAADVRDIAEHLDVIRGVGAADPDPLRVQFSVAFDTIQCCTGQAGGDTAMDQLTFGARGGRLEDALPFVLDRVDLLPRVIAFDGTF